MLCSCRCVSLFSWFCCAPRCAWVDPAGSVLLFAFRLAPLSVLFVSSPAVCPVWCPHLVFAGTVALGIWLQLLCLFVFCMCCFLVYFGFVFCVVVVFVSLCCVFCCLMNVTVHRTMYQSSTSLLLRPLQSRPLRDLINQLILFHTGKHEKRASCLSSYVLHMQHACLTSLVLAGLLCCKKAAAACKNNFRIKTVSTNFFSIKGHVVPQTSLFTRIFSSNSKNIKNVVKNIWQLPETKMQSS